MSEGDNYTDRQRTRDREYADAWAKLTPRQRQELAKAGVCGPDLPVYRTGKHDQSAPLAQAACASEAEPEGASAESCDGALLDTAAVLRRLLGELMARDRIELSVECFALATGVGYDGASMTEIARRHGVTRAAVSKRCVELTEALGLPPPRAMRRLTARRSYERRARDHHASHAY